MPSGKSAIRISWLLLVFFASCEREQVSVEAAMSACEYRALQATAPPSTTIGFGWNTAGIVSTGIAIETSADYLSGRRPAEIFEECVVERSGEPPTRTLAEQLDERIN